MNGKKLNWYQVIWVLATHCEDYRYLLVKLSRFRQDHPKIRSLNRCARYVLIHDYSTAFMAQLSFCAEHIDEFVEWRREYGL